MGSHLTYVIVDVSKSERTVMSMVRKWTDDTIDRFIPMGCDSYKWEFEEALIDLDERWGTDLGESDPEFRKELRTLVIGFVEKAITAAYHDRNDWAMGFTHKGKKFAITGCESWGDVNDEYGDFELAAAAIELTKKVQRDPKWKACPKSELRGVALNLMAAALEAEEDED